MRNFNFADKIIVVASAQSMASSKTHDIDVSAYKFAAIQIVWAALDTSDNTFTLFASADGNNFEEYDTALTTVAAPSGNHIFDVACRGINILRVVYSRVGATTGNYSVGVSLEVAA
jgi:hypothetical protein